MRKACLIALAAILSTSAIATSARAGTIADGIATPEGTVTVSVSQTIAGTAGPGSGGARCRWEAAGSASAVLDGHNAKYQDGITYTLYARTCDGVMTWAWVPVITSAALALDLRDRAIRQLPKPAPNFIPTSEWQYASWPTDLWFDAANVTTPPLSASIPGLTVTLTPTATKVTFTPGNDDDQVICERVPREKGDCTYTYPTSSVHAPDQKFPASVAVTWTFPYTSSTGANGVLAPITLTTGLNIPVARIQVINI